MLTFYTGRKPHAVLKIEATYVCIYVYIHVYIYMYVYIYRMATCRLLGLRGFKWNCPAKAHLGIFVLGSIQNSLATKTQTSKLLTQGDSWVRHNTVRYRSIKTCTLHGIASVALVEHFCLEFGQLSRVSVFLEGLSRETFAKPTFTCGSTWGINLDTNI